MTAMYMSARWVRWMSSAWLRPNGEELPAAGGELVAARHVRVHRAVLLPGAVQLAGRHVAAGGDRRQHRDERQRREDPHRARAAEPQRRDRVRAARAVPISSTRPIWSIATPRCVATSSSSSPFSTVRPPSAAWKRISTNAAMLTRTSKRSRAPVAPGCPCEIGDQDRDDARQHAVRVLHDHVRVDGGNRPPPHRGQPSVPLPAAPQPRPESLIRTTPPTMISANTSAAVEIGEVAEAARVAVGRRRSSAFRLLARRFRDLRPAAVSVCARRERGLALLHGAPDVLHRLEAADCRDHVEVVLGRR